jgi:predicted RNA polymerase sigma factor
MRFMIIVKANKDSEAGVLPDRKILTEMGKFNQELVKASDPEAPEVHGLVALMEIQASRARARVDSSGAPSVRGDLLARVGRFDEARMEFHRAAALTRNTRERDLLLDRARACAKEAEA